MKLTSERMRQAGTFLANFTLAKAAIYLAPLGIAAIAVSETYAAMEFAFALAPFIALVLGTPYLSAIPQIYLVRGDRRIFDLAAAIASGAMGLLLVGGLAALLAGETTLALCAFAAACVSAQSAASAITRTTSRRNMAAWTDGLATLLMFLAAGLAWFVFGSWFDVDDVAIAWFIICLPAFIFALLFWLRTRVPELRIRLRQAFQLGLPMVINGLFGLAIASSGRIALGVFAQSWDLAAYAIGFRLAGLMLGLHQLMVTAFFARVYGARARAFDRMVPSYLIIVAASGTILCAAVPFLLPLIEIKALTQDRQAALATWLPLIAAQVYLWISSATLEFRINRARMAGRLIMPNIGVTLIGLGGFVWLDASDMASPASLVAGAALFTAAFVAVQFGALWRRGLKLPRTGLAILGGVVPFLALALIG